MYYIDWNFHIDLRQTGYWSAIVMLNLQRSCPASWLVGWRVFGVSRLINLDNLKSAAYGHFGATGTANAQTELLDYVANCICRRCNLYLFVTGVGHTRIVGCLRNQVLLKKCCFKKQESVVFQKTSNRVVGFSNIMLSENACCKSMSNCSNRRVTCTQYHATSKVHVYSPTRREHIYIYIHIDIVVLSCFRP